MGRGRERKGVIKEGSEMRKGRGRKGMMRGGSGMLRERSEGKRVERKGKRMKVRG